MELTQTSTRTVNQVTAEQDGYRLTATVTVKDGKVTNIDGSVASTTDVETVEQISFSGFRNGGKLKLNFNNLDVESMSGVCSVVAAMTDAVVSKYEITE